MHQDVETTTASFCLAGSVVLRQTETSPKKRRKKDRIVARLMKAGLFQEPSQLRSQNDLSYPQPSS